MQTIFTIGHSTREVDEFINLLQVHSVTLLVDIRTIPKYRHNPQYGQAEIMASLIHAGIDYAYIKKLGGLRPATKNSTNEAWKNKSFRNYADYMQTDDFKDGVEELLHISSGVRAAIMCTEAVPWRCHRSLVADALVARGVQVCEVIGQGNVRQHRLTPFAAVDGEVVTYPKPQ